MDKALSPRKVIEMGFLDSIQSAMNRGQAAAGRGMETMKLNNRIKEIAKQRQALATQLGASLYEETRNNEMFRAGRESLYDGIAALDAEREQCLADIAAIEEAAKAEEQAAMVLTCPNCGATVGNNDLFCSGCGKKVEEIKAELGTVYSGLACPNCGAPIAEDDVFCCGCGQKIEKVEAAPVEEPAPAADPVCPSCGAPVVEGSVFCSGCGQPLA